MPSHTYKSQFTTEFEFSQANFSETHKIKPDFSIVYTHGLYSDPWGRKPEAIKAFCSENNIPFFRFELAGHGSDKKHYEEIDFNVWKDQILEVTDDLVKGPILYIGSSIGGWLSLIAARDRPERAKGVIGLAPAPDFTYDMEKYVLTAAQKDEMSINGRLLFPMKDFTYIFTQKVFNTARDNLLLEGPLTIKCPIHIIHGSEDKNLDPQKPFKLMKCVESEDVIVKLIKGSNHRLGRDVDIAEIKNSIQSFIG